MHAVILAGGKGTRLRPYTVVIPKPLMPIGEIPILEVVVRQLQRSGFKKITMAVNHQYEIIKAFFKDGSKWDIEIDYSIEEKFLSTMGPLKLLKNLPEDFLVMNGDILTDLNFSTFFNTHKKDKSLFTISSYQRTQKIDYGVLEIDKSGTLSSFREKPIYNFDVSMGIYMLNKKILNHIPDEIPYGFDDLMIELLKKNKKVVVRTFDGYWMDIGRPLDYEKAIKDFKAMQDILLK